MNDGVRERTSLTGISQLWLAAGRGFARLFRSARAIELIHVPGGSLARTGLPVPDLNCGVISPGDDAAAATRLLAGELQRRNIPGILLVPDAAAGRRFPVRRATTAADLAAANRIIAAAFELPQDTVAAAFRHDLLNADDVAIELVCDGGVSDGCLQVTAGDNAVGIWSMATPPEQRRRGIARAGLEHVLAKRLSAADSRAFLIATAAGRPLNDAIGFETVASCTAWFLAGAAAPRA